MAHSVSSSQRALTLPEELEKLEQSITLTLQEIDHNFSRAHRIVTTSILPIVEQYAQHSKSVWEGSKFWKQFFEASANVSLSGYEEPQAEEETVTESTTAEETPSSSFYTSPRQPDDLTTDLDDSELYRQQNDTSLSNITPRAQQSSKPTLAAYSSPYEALRREVQGRPPQSNSPSNSTLPSTPRAQVSSATPESSPFLPLSTDRPHSPSVRHRTPSNDRLLHRVLDKTYRLQATPHNQPRLPIRSYSNVQAQKHTPRTARQAPSSNTEGPDSSPLLPAPELHTEIFDSPARGRPQLHPRPIPGVSILTPAKAKIKTETKQTPSIPTTEAKPATAKERKNRIFDSDSDSDSEADFMAGMSPPKTLQFYVPQSKLLRTPAREASKRIVDDILLTAGGGDVTATEDLDSPSVVRKGGGGGTEGEEDTF